MFGRDLKRQVKNQPIQARTINDPIAVVESLSRLRVGAGLALTWVNGIPLIRATGAGSGAAACYYTTSAITTATRSGTTVADSVLTLGSGTARACVDATDPTLIPDPAGSDETIYNQLNGAIAINQFVLCEEDDDGRWIITIAWC